jgi:hypothetical protein
MVRRSRTIFVIYHKDTIMKFFRLLIPILLLLTLNIEASDKKTEVTKLYIATFDRIPDIVGLDYWVDNTLDVDDIAKSFFDQRETQQRYPEGSSTDSFVTAVYKNLFNRTPDSGGLEYWSSELDSQNISKDRFILAVINGALGNDADILEKKTIFALDFMKQNSGATPDEYEAKSKAEFETYSRSLDESDPLDKLKDEYNALIDKVEEEIDRAKNNYEEYTGSDQDRGQKPFVVEFQDTQTIKDTLVLSRCSSSDKVKYIAYSTPTDAQSSYFSDTATIITSPQSSIYKPFLDIRYFNPMSKYIDSTNSDFYPNHSTFTGLDSRDGIENITIGTDASRVDMSGGVVQAECINDELSVGTTINLFDAPEQSIIYGGPQATLIYQLSSSSISSPWSSDQRGNIVLQGYFDEPIYIDHGANTGGSVSFGLFLNNKKTGKKLNYVIAIYAIGEAWIKEKAGIKFDPTTGIVHVATLIKDSSWWCTKSPQSKEMKEVSSTPNRRSSDDGVWGDFYRVNISYQNLLAVLDELHKNPPAGAEGVDFGLSPEDWEVSSVMLQSELEESGGKALLSGSFKGFEVYTSLYPLN